MNTSSWKAMFWKECRENVRWAVLALLALSLGLAYAWSRLPSSPILAQAWSGENLVLTITTPLIGLALGLLQILPELRRDQWAFLVHRPASRTALFFGKVLPGVCLYFAAAILPLLGLAIWTASPSHVPAPFDFRFTLAGWAAILSGLPFYFAGLLVALRPARWYGSRALPLLTALLAPLAANGLPEFWLVVVISLLTTTALMAATWGSFLSGGEYEEQAKPARFVLGLTLYPAVLAVGIGMMTGVVGVYHALESKTAGGGEWWRNDDKIDTQGRLFHVTEHGTDAAQMNLKTVTVTDAAGHPVDPKVWQNLTQQKKLLSTVYLFVKPSAGNYVTRYQEPTRYVPFLGSNGSADLPLNWYYDLHSRQIVGYRTGEQSPVAVGPNGFSADRAQAGQFPEGTPYPGYFSGRSYLRFPHSLFWYDTLHPSAGLLHTSVGPGGIVGVAAPADQDAEYGDASDRDSPHAEVLLVASDGQITVYARARREDPAEKTRKLFSTPLAFPVSTYVQGAIMPDLSRFFFWYGGEGTAPGHIVTVASDGRILKTETLPVPAQTAEQKTAQAAPLRQGLPGLLVPPVFAVTSGIYAAVGHALKDETAEGWWRGFGNGGVLFSVLFFSALGGLMPAVLGGFISRRLGDGRRGQVAWAFGTFWLGGYGVLLLLALRAWPARVSCPNCGRQRVVNRETCEHCGAAFARPRRDGTEIFEEEREQVMR